jgi:hypothetical protein
MPKIDRFHFFFIKRDPPKIIVCVTFIKVELRCVIGGRRVPEYVSRAIQWIDQSRGQTINTFNSGRRVNKKVQKTYY